MNGFSAIRRLIPAVLLILTAPATGVDFVVEEGGGVTSLKLVPPDEVFHTTQAAVTSDNLIDAGGGLLLMLWSETPEGGSAVPYYAFSFDGGQSVSRVRATSYVLKLDYGEFDPLVDPAPQIPPEFQADPSDKLYIVQFFTPGLPQLRQGVESLGASVGAFLPNNARIVDIGTATTEDIATLDYVRWVGEYHPAYRLEEFIRDNLECPSELCPDHRYNINVLVPGLAQKNAVGDAITTLGGTVDMLTQNGVLMQATLTPAQLQEVMHLDQVAFLDRWSPPEVDMDIARQIGGADQVESVAGFEGDAVRGEVLDNGITATAHPGWVEYPEVHGALYGGSVEHGTNVYGTVFMDPGVGGEPRGMLPGGHGILGSFWRLFENQHSDALVDRYCHTCELVADSNQDCASVCPDGYTPAEGSPYNAVFQTNSWGGSTIPAYNSVSQTFDDIVLTYDVLACQSQGNSGTLLDPFTSEVVETTASRVQSWAKNVVSVGGVYHKDTLPKGDDVWKMPFDVPAPASHGPARDNRIKPDLTHFYDKVYTTAGGGGFRDDFGGTSAATPITCGHFGLFFQIWHEGAFPGFGGGASVFDSRPHMTTAKAMTVNTAVPYCFNDPLACPDSDLSRYKQGWGMVHIGNLYARRHQFAVIEDEGTVLDWNSESAVYTVTVPLGALALRATMVYADPGGTTGTTQHAINDLDLKLTHVASGTFYWGNRGLRSSNTSTPGGSHNDNNQALDTVENVFIDSPAAGQWQVAVIVDVLEEDAHLETPEMDADYALVVQIEPDCDGNSSPDSEDPNCDGFGLPDACESASLYVDASHAPGGSGASWADAFDDLQTAINTVAPPAEIWVKAGDYGPISLRSGVAIYGGFAGTETARSESDPAANVTNIVGDASAKHIVTSIGDDASAVLRGFHIKNGNASGTDNEADGGGLYLENSSPTIVECVFHENDANENGGAVANRKNAGGIAGSPTFVNCVFHRNKDGDSSGDVKKGGAVYSEAGGAKFYNCLFHKNEAERGGAVYVAGGAPTFKNCTIADNIAVSSGGGVYDSSGASIVHNSILYFNDANGSGDQIYNESGTTTVTYSDVKGGWTGAGNIDSNPFFTEKVNDDYTLMNGVRVSPCINVANLPDLPADAGNLDWDCDLAEQHPFDLGGQFFGHNRLRWCDLDMGAYEVQIMCAEP